MSKKSSSIAFGFLPYVLSLLILLCGCAKNDEQNGGPSLIFEESTYDFGVLKRDGEAIHVFHFQNVGKAPVRIEDVKSDCACTVALPTKREYMPGEKGKLTVAFNPAGKRVGFHDKKILILTSDDSTRNQRVEIFIKATVEHEIIIAPKQVVVRPAYDEEVRREITITDFREKPFRIREIDTSFPHVQATLKKVEHKTGRRYTIEVTVLRSYPCGPIDANVRVYTDDKDYSVFSVPIKGEKLGIIEVIPKILYFGVMEVGEGKTRIVKLSSKKHAPIEVERAESDISGLSLNSEATTDGSVQLVVSTKGINKATKLKGTITLFVSKPVRKEVVVPVYGIIK